MLDILRPLFLVLVVIVWISFVVYVRRHKIKGIAKLPKLVKKNIAAASGMWEGITCDAYNLNGDAYICGTAITVWQIEQARRLISQKYPWYDTYQVFSKLSTKYPELTRSQITTALLYAKHNAREIALAIEEHEENEYGEKSI